MPLLLPEELVASISQQWPCRQLQIRQLAKLLSPRLPSFPAIVVHGPEASGKSTILTEVLDAYTCNDTRGDVVSTRSRYKKRRLEKVDENSSSRESQLYCVVKVAECITARHLLTRIISSTIATLHSAGTTDEEWIRIANNSKCEHISGLPGTLGELLDKAGCNKFVLVLDGIDNLREGGQMLLAAFARVGELVRSLSIVFVLRLSPRPIFLQATGVPHVYFPPYTREEAISIVAALGPPDVHGLPVETAAKLYEPFLSTLYDSLIGPTASTIPVFRSTCQAIWPRFVSPIVNGEVPPGPAQKGQWDFARLLVKGRSLFQQQGEQMLVHHIVSDSSQAESSLAARIKASTVVNKNPTSHLPSLPYLSNLVLIAAFLAAHTPPRMDTTFFSKFTTARKKRIRRRKRVAAPPDDVDDPTATPCKKSIGNKSTIPSSGGGDPTLCRFDLP
ncbi:hypothetical protein VTO42DRAFT_527 [Malbranchea cinnamomea]